MRNAIERLKLPDHAGLAYTRYAPPKPEGDPKGSPWANWLDSLDRLQVNPDYDEAFRRWRASFNSQPGNVLCEIELTSRLLVGHGEKFGTEVGLTLHHTWGVPIVPGSALKGLTAHYTETVYGPDQPGDTSDPERVRYQGPVWDGRRIVQGPGDVYATIFGSPDADDGWTEAMAGHVIFHDAWYVPNPNQRNPFARDVLTVHQKRYYDKKGSEGLPNDYDSPNPVSFLTVQPGTKFLVAFSGPQAWSERARDLLIEAWSDWGLGGKTSAGYGRAVLGKTTVIKADSPVLTELKAWLESKTPLEGQTEAPSNRVKLEALQQEPWSSQFAASDAAIRKEAADLIRRQVNRGKDSIIALRDAICKALEG